MNINWTITLYQWPRSFEWNKTFEIDLFIFYMKNVIMHVIFLVLKSYFNTTALFHGTFNTIIIKYNLIIEYISCLKFLHISKLILMKKSVRVEMSIKKFQSSWIPFFSNQWSIATENVQNSISLNTVLKIPKLFKQKIF